MADANYYEILGLTPNATNDEIRTSYVDLAKRVHPDSGGTDALFRHVNLAYETLSDPARRAAYDRNGYVDEQNPQPDAPPPGWRRKDGPQNGSSQSRSSSDSDAHDDSPPDESTKKPPPGPPPRTAGTAAAPSDADSDISGAALRRHASANPSWALLIAGILMLMFATQFGGATASFLLFGFIAAVIGFVGVLGRKKAAHRAAIERANMVSIDRMTGTEFEQRLQAAFQHVGYTVYHVGGRGDFGADLVLDLPGTRAVVQAKRWSTAVGPGAVQEVVASRAHYNAQSAIVVTTSTFTSAALELAASNKVEMWDRNRLIEFLATQEVGPPRTGSALLGEEVKAGAPTALRGGLIVFATLLSASVTASNSRRRQRKRR